MVFNGGLDQLFDRDKIRFDRIHGGYSPVVDGRRRVIVKAEDPTLWHWSVNALNRYHYLGISENSGTDGLPRLIVHSSSLLIWSVGEKSIELPSFEALIAILKQDMS